MGRVIRSQSGTSRRKRMLRLIATALRYAAEGNPDQGETWDLIAFVLLCLREIQVTVGRAAEAWERRDYWVKADRFRHEWRWVDSTAQLLDTALVASDLEAALAAALELAQSLDGAKPYKSNKNRPWAGALSAWRGDDDGAVSRLVTGQGVDDR